MIDPPVFLSVRRWVQKTDTNKKDASELHQFIDIVVTMHFLEVVLVKKGRVAVG